LARSSPNKKPTAKTSKPPVLKLKAKLVTPTPVPKGKSKDGKGEKVGARRLEPIRMARQREEEPEVDIPRPAAVPTNGRPRKNLAGFTAKELEFFRDLLLAKRREIVGDMSSMEREALRSSGGTNLSNLPLHMADMGTDNYEQEFTLGLMEKDRKLLRDLNDGLAKIQDGTFGLCEGTGKPISKARLEAQPWARYSIEYARKLEGRLR
jgi:RNA polymerase-binding protein DksA